MHDVKPLDEENRRYVHEIDHPRLKLSYDVTLQAGLHSLDEDANIVHVECHDDLQTLDLHVIDLQEVVARLETVKFLVGDGSWGCHSGTAKDKDTEARVSDSLVEEPIYRRVESVESVHDADNLVRLKTVPVPLHHMFERSSISLEVIPLTYDHKTERMKTKAAHRQNSSLVSSVRRLKDAEEFNDRTYIYTEDMHEIQSIMEAMRWGFNYDFDNAEVKDRVIQMNPDYPSSGPSIECEECYYYLMIGIVFRLDIDLDMSRLFFPEVVSIPLYPLYRESPTTS